MRYVLCARNFESCAVQPGCVETVEKRPETKHVMRNRRRPHLPQLRHP
jgi:hypothetical protein